jgi:hypothetical protein
LVDCTKDIVRRAWLIGARPKNFHDCLFQASFPENNLDENQQPSRSIKNIGAELIEPVD